MPCIYIFRDRGVPNAVKIGFSKTWQGNGETKTKAGRFKGARSHTPRGIDIVCIWEYPGASRADLEKTERALLGEFDAWPHSDASEWRTTTPKDAISIGAKLLGRPRVIPTPSIGTYDDWREKDDRGKERQFLWVHREQGLDGDRFKVIFSTLYDTAFHYTFTYNPFSVRLVAGYQIGADNLSWGQVSQGNRWIQGFWTDFTTRYGRSVPKECLGWLDKEIAFSEVDRAIRRAGFTRFRLDRPKPPRARVVDGSGIPATPIGSTPSLRRVDEMPWGDPLPMFSNLKALGRLLIRP